MYFNNPMFSQKYVNFCSYGPVTDQARYQQDQNQKIEDALKAVYDLCDAVKGMDGVHRQEAWNLCWQMMLLCLNNNSPT